MERACVEISTPNMFGRSSRVRLKKNLEGPDGTSIERYVVF